MNDLLGVLRAQGAWAIALAIGLPLALIAITELGFALARRAHPATVWVRRVRTWVLPAVAAVLYLRAVLAWPSDDVWVRMAETATWVVLVIVALGAANAVLFDAAAVGSWQRRVPRLLRDLVRILLVVVAAALAYSFIWDREIQGALAALGVTSIVVGLALQEPLGNLFSGLMLLMERPFEIGDSIEVGGVAGTVKEINWRSAHIEALGGMIQVVPNSTLNKETISNYSRPLPIRMEMLELAFSADDPPNQVRRALLDVARTTTGVIQSPKPIAATIGYGNNSVNYRLIWRVAEDDRWSVRNDLITRIWYMTRRHGLTMPYPVGVNIQHVTEAPFQKPAPLPEDTLARIPHLPKLPAVENGGVRALSFGKGEVVFDEGQQQCRCSSCGRPMWPRSRRWAPASSSARPASTACTPPTRGRLPSKTPRCCCCGPTPSGSCSRPAPHWPATPDVCSTSGAGRCSRRGARCGGIEPSVRLADRFRAHPVQRRFAARLPEQHAVTLVARSRRRPDLKGGPGDAGALQEHHRGLGLVERCAKRLGAAAGERDRPPEGDRRFECGGRAREGLELVDAAIGHQRQEQVPVLDHIRADGRPVLDDAIVHRLRRAGRAGERQRAECKLARRRGYPGPAAAIAVDAGGERAVAAKAERVFRSIVRRYDGVVPALEPHQLPGRSGERRRRRLPDCRAGECRERSQ
jgi:small-conductance mechanosensitive channel